ncbi:MAG: sulfurtransferase [Pseudomonadota bacterium]|nr:sulfurtransferase [Pseudomonadota bacterium]MDP1903496.1 sulfurtransferase [Pseudomonadota bacterium]MDP2351547.1 sulfurtransferase [Pseudomonadota bacterium]
MRQFLLLIVGFWATQAMAGASFLVSTGELATELAQGRVRLVDAENAENYARAHLAGALNLPYLDLEDAEENAKTGLPIFPRLAASKFEALGIARDTPVVVYDSGNGRGASAVRYILRFLGHPDARILDGGFRKWLKEGRPVTQAVPQPAKATYLAQPNLDWALKTEALKTDALKGRNALILDARSIAEYAGKDAGGARQAGHIPGAKSLPWTLLAGELDTFKSPEEMRRVLLEAGVTPDREIVTYCNPGIGRSTFLSMALESLGYDKVKVYPGSWIEWAADPIRPIER